MCDGDGRTGSAVTAPDRARPDKQHGAEPMQTSRRREADDRTPRVTHGTKARENNNDHSVSGRENSKLLWQSTKDCTQSRQHRPPIDPGLQQPSTRKNSTFDQLQTYNAKHAGRSVVDEDATREVGGSVIVHRAAGQ